jgi:3',5'-cyclic AMP phosphodiesterase CpdA
LGGAALTPRIAAAPPPDGKAEGAWYALVADIHIAADPARRVFHQNMTDHLKAVVADILAAAEPPHGVVIAGDLAMWDGQPGDYHSLLLLLEPLRAARIPIHMALGNHDDRGYFREVLPSGSLLDDKQVSAVDGQGLRFVLLDSLEEVCATSGRLGPAQLDWLAKDLDAHDMIPTIVVVHHNPKSVPWSKVPGLEDSGSLMEVLSSRHHVKAVVFGHTHVFRVRNQDGLHLINLPATAYSFDSHQPLGYCRFRPDANGAGCELRCVGGNRAPRWARGRLRFAWRNGQAGAKGQGRMRPDPGAAG